MIAQDVQVNSDRNVSVFLTQIYRMTSEDYEHSAQDYCNYNSASERKSHRFEVSKRWEARCSSSPVVALLRLRDVLTGFLDSWLNELELKHCIVILSSVLNSDRKVSGRGCVCCIFPPSPSALAKVMRVWRRHEAREWRFIFDLETLFQACGSFWSGEQRALIEQHTWLTFKH